MKTKLTNGEIDRFKKTKEGEAYLEYNEKVGGNPIGLCVPYGYPDGVEQMGGVIPVYEACIKKGVTWEVLLDFKEDEGAEY